MNFHRQLRSILTVVALPMMLVYYLLDRGYE
jgi:hypothetical protein